MKVSKLLLGTLVFFVPFISNAQDFLTKVKLYPNSKYERSEMIGLLEIDHFMPMKDGGIEVEISQKHLSRLKQSNFKYQILIPNVSSWLDSTNRKWFQTQKIVDGRVAFEKTNDTVGNIIPRPAAFQVKSTFAGYYTFDQMQDAIDDLVAAYPGIASKQSIGTTVNGNTLWVVKISDNVGTDESEPEAFFMGLQHPREAITGASMIFFMQYLCEQYSLNTKVKELVDSREIFIMPCFNPDGYEYNYTSTSGNGGGSWRKNRRLISGNYGVDLNRNWGVDWGNCNAPIQGNASSCGSGTGSSDTYYDPSAFSENETQAVRAFAKTRNFKTAFDQHAYGPYYSLPFGRQSLHNTSGTDMSPKDSAFYRAIPALMGKYNGMRAADSYDALGYEVAGGFKDWMLTGEIGVGTKDSVWGMTGEGAAGGGTPAFGSMSNFWAPASQIVTLCKGMCYQNIQLALAAGSYADIQDASDVALMSKNGNFSFRLQRLGLTSNSYTVSILPLQNITSVGAPVTVSALTYYQAYNGTISYTLPASITNGQRVRYILKVETGGISYSDTITKLYNPTSLLSDDMQGTLTTNWNTYGTAGSSGLGYNYVAGTWTLTSSGGYNSTKALSESAAGTRYGARVRAYVQCNSTFNLSDATAAYLTFWVRHRAENFRDKVQVQISTNGSSWTAIAGKTTVKEPGTLDEATINGQSAMTGIRDLWAQEFFDLEAYRGFGTVYLRFEFTSDDDLSGFEYQTDDGFYIDDIKVVKSSAVLITLPVNALNFKAALQPNRTVQLNWSAVNDGKQDYFEIERSADGNNFNTITKVDANSFAYTDVKPENGLNYYRLRQTNKDGQVVYSKIILVNLKTAMGIAVYPNPATDNINIQLTAEKTANLTLQICDASGKQVHSQALRMTNNLLMLNLDVKSWPAQLYLVRIVDANNQVIAVQRVIKN